MATDERQWPARVPVTRLEVVLFGVLLLVAWTLGMPVGCRDGTSGARFHGVPVVVLLGLATIIWLVTQALIVMALSRYTHVRLDAEALTLGRRALRKDTLQVAFLSDEKPPERALEVRGQVQDGDGREASMRIGTRSVVYASGSARRVRVDAVVGERDFEELMGQLQPNAERSREPETIIDVMRVARGAGSALLQMLPWLATMVVVPTLCIVPALIFGEGPISRAITLTTLFGGISTGLTLTFVRSTREQHRPRLRLLITPWEIRVLDGPTASVLASAPRGSVSVRTGTFKVSGKYGESVLQGITLTIPSYGSLTLHLTDGELSNAARSHSVPVTDLDVPADQCPMLRWALNDAYEHQITQEPYRAPFVRRGSPPPRRPWQRAPWNKSSRQTWIVFHIGLLSACLAASAAGYDTRDMVGRLGHAEGVITACESDGTESQKRGPSIPLYRWDYAFEDTSGTHYVGSSYQHPAAATPGAKVPIVYSLALPEVISSPSPRAGDGPLLWRAIRTISFFTMMGAPFLIVLVLAELSRKLLSWGSGHDSVFRVKQPRPLGSVARDIAVAAMWTALHTAMAGLVFFS